jgi:hypothetical protein
MKKINLTAVLLVCVLAFSSCKKDKSDPTNRGAQNTKEFFENLGPQTQVESWSFGQSNPSSKTVSLKGGTKITIEPGSFTVNGIVVNGDIKLEAIEVLNRSAVLLSGTNTNHISGVPLISQGFIFLDVKVNGVKVDKTLAKPIKISIPAKGKDFTMIWEGVENVGDVNQMAWQAPRDAAGGQQRDVKSVENNFVFNFGQLGWVNCDIFYNSSAPKTTVRVTIPNNPGTMATFRGFTGETFVFFCAKGDNVVAQIYTPDGTNTVKSYDNSMPVGSEGMLIAFSIKDGKYYLASKEITITADLSETLTLVETTESAVQAAISTLDNY